MARPRKTLSVELLKAKMNSCIATCPDEDRREQWCNFMEFILWEADAYAGFRYIDGWNGTETYRRQYY